MGLLFYTLTEEVNRTASGIKDIAVEIGGDTTEQAKAPEGVNKNSMNPQTQFKAVHKLPKLDPSNAELP